MRNLRVLLMRKAAVQAARSTRATTRQQCARLAHHPLAVHLRPAASTRAFSQMALRSHPRVLQSFGNLRAFSSAAAPETVTVPSMGDSISEGTVVEWIKKPGDFVEEDEVVVVLETDKVSVDVRAPFAGVVGELLAKVDDNVLIGAPLFQIMKQDSGKDASSAAVEPAAAAAAVAPTPTTASAKAPVAKAANAAADDSEVLTVNVPSMGDSISEGTIITINRTVGDYVGGDETVLVLETDKVSVDVKAPVGGKIVRFMGKLDEEVRVGSPLFELEPCEDPNPAKTPAPPAHSAMAVSADAVKTKKSAPSEQPSVAFSKPSSPVAASTQSTASAGRFKRNETRVEMSLFKVRTAQRMKDTQNAAAMLSTFQECDVSELLQMREELGETFEKTHGVQLGFLSSFLKASALALQKVPAVNAFLDMDAKEIVYNDFADINVTVASQHGLVRPVLRNVESMNLADIEKNLTNLRLQAQTGTLAVEDLAGGTFSVANGHVNGSLLSTNMLVSPQSAVLGMHAVKTRPFVLKNGQVVPRPMMFLALTYDHRIIDGREAVTFLKSIAEAVADPRRLLLEL